MPPKKERKEQFIGDQASELVLDYLIKQNRPYSAAGNVDSNVSANLHNAVTKTTATKVLKELHEAGEIEGRIAGKQIVYHAKQNPEDNASEEDLKAMDAEYEELKEEIGSLKARLKALQPPGTMLNSAPTIEQLLPLLESTELEVAIFEENLQRLQAVGECQLDPEEVKKKRVEMQRVEKVYLRRKKQFTEFWATIAENYEGRKQDLWEKLGLDDVDA